MKRDLLARISAVAPSDSLVATSSSGILISDIQDAAAYPERVLLGHPINPPHLIPLVEVLGGRMTSEDAIKKALTFYGSISATSGLMQCNKSRVDDAGAAHSIALIGRG